MKSRRCFNELCFVSNLSVWHIELHYLTFSGQYQGVTKNIK